MAALTSGSLFLPFTLDALLNQEKVEKEKWETTEEFAERLRNLGVAEKYVAQAMKDGFIQFENQQQLMEGLGDTYLTWINALREAYDMTGLNSDSVAALVTQINTLGESIDQTTESLNEMIAAQSQWNAMNAAEAQQMFGGQQGPAGPGVLTPYLQQAQTPISEYMGPSPALMQHQAGVITQNHLNTLIQQNQLLREGNQLLRERKTLTGMMGRYEKDLAYQLDQERRARGA